MTYNPADYVAVENTAKAMSKPELESYYVKDRDNKHQPFYTFAKISWIIAMFLILLSCIIIIDNIPERIQEIETSITNEVCQISDDIYVSIGEKDSPYYVKIDCLTYRHK